jgi:hypothetical protein
MALREMEIEFSKYDITGITVEILDPETLNYNDPVISFAVDPQEPIVSQWPLIRPQIIPLLGY